jgi:hypothetical protein
MSLCERHHQGKRGDRDAIEKTVLHFHSLLPAIIRP